MGNRTYLNFEVRQILIGIESTWCILYPGKTKYQVIRRILETTFKRQKLNYRGKPSNFKL